MHEIVTLIAKYFILLSAVGAFIAWLRLTTKDKKRFVVQAFIGAVLALVLAKIGSKLFYNPRPFVVGHFTPYFAHGNDNGFPSDHTLLASFLAFLSWYYSKKMGLILLAIALLIGLSRVIAGVHHLIDIIGSLAFAYVGAWLAWQIIQRLVPVVTAGRRKPSERSS